MLDLEALNPVVEDPNVPATIPAPWAAVGVLINDLGAGGITYLEMPLNASTGNTSWSRSTTSSAGLRRVLRRDRYRFRDHRSSLRSVITGVPVRVIPDHRLWLLELLWDQFAALLRNRPVYNPFHRLGCHRRRIADRTMFINGCKCCGSAAHIRRPCALCRRKG